VPSHVVVLHKGVELARLELKSEKTWDNTTQYRFDQGHEIVSVVGPERGRGSITIPDGAWITLVSEDGGYLRDSLWQAGTLHMGPNDTLQITWRQIANGPRSQATPNVGSESARRLTGSAFGN
jgi:hypothetical protein